MGPLTMSPNLIREKDGKLEVTANVRMPRGNTPEKLTQAINGKVNAWAAANKGQGRNRLPAGRPDGARCASAT